MNKKILKLNLFSTKSSSYQLKHVVSTFHKFHIVDPSPWPIMAACGSLFITVGGVSYMHKFIGGWNLLLNGIVLMLYVMYVWWRDIVREATYEQQHTFVVQRGLRLGMILFIVSETMFFFSFFWAFFHSSLSPVYNIGGVWPPKSIVPINPLSIPLTNTILLISSAITITWAHHAIRLKAKRHSVISLLYTLFLAFLFTCFQGVEYVTAPFNISDGIYGSCFYMTTGFHGFHVLIGTIAIGISFIRLVMNHFTNTQHLGFETALWYWHFVDVVWIFLYLTIYCWG